MTKDRQEVSGKPYGAGDAPLDLPPDHGVCGESRIAENHGLIASQGASGPGPPGTGKRASVPGKSASCRTDRAPAPSVTVGVTFYVPSAGGGPTRCHGTAVAYMTCRIEGDTPRLPVTCAVSAAGSWPVCGIRLTLARPDTPLRSWSARVRPGRHARATPAGRAAKSRARPWIRSHTAFQAAPHAIPLGSPCGPGPQRSARFTRAAIDVV